MKRRGVPGYQKESFSDGRSKAHAMDHDSLRDVTRDRAADVRPLLPGPTDSKAEE